MNEKDIVDKLQQSIKTKNDYIKLISEIIEEYKHEHMSEHKAELEKYKKEIEEEQVLIEKIKNLCVFCSNKSCNSVESVRKCQSSNQS